MISENDMKDMLNRCFGRNNWTELGASALRAEINRVMPAKNMSNFSDAYRISFKHSYTSSENRTSEMVTARSVTEDIEIVTNRLRGFLVEAVGVKHDDDSLFLATGCLISAKRIMVEYVKATEEP